MATALRRPVAKLGAGIVTGLIALVGSFGLVTSAALAANPAAAVPDQFDEELDGDDQFVEIIERDEGLVDTPPTGYAPEGVEVDEVVELTLEESTTYLGQGVMYEGFVFDGAVPGPMVQIDEGDVVRFEITNDGDYVHGASIHAAYTQTSEYLAEIEPGETASVTFRATYPGVFMYHCAPGGHAIPMHVLGGQYGMVAVEPDDDYRLEQEMGHEPDLELYLVQNELYASGADAVEGRPAYTSFNGRVFGYVDEPIDVEPGDYVRMYYLNVGPNLTATFHIVGIIWDYVYWQGHPEARMPGGQTVIAGPSDSWVVEFRIPPAEGAYTMVDHAFGPASRGTIGILNAEEGVDGPDVVRAEGPDYSDEQLEELADEVTRTISPFQPGSQQLESPEVYGPHRDEVVVEIKGNAYDPPVVEVEEGTTVTFVNQDVYTYPNGQISGVHDAVTTDAPDSFATDLLEHGQRDSVQLEIPGVYDYFCTPHPYMEGRIVVRESEEDDGLGCSAVGGPAAPVVAVLVLLGLAAVRGGDEG